MTVVVIGGGAAGLMAAATVKGASKLTVLERNERPARKVMITGKGRCNVTNNCDVPTLLANTVHNARFLYSAYYAFDSSAVMDFFESQGVPLKTERGNRVFPVSDKAVDIVDALIKAAKQNGARFMAGQADEILTADGAVCGVKTKDGQKLACDKVILATGGLSYPVTGSTGDGHRMAKRLGHTVRPMRGSLVPLNIKEGFCTKMSGLSLKNVRLTVFEEGKRKPIFTEQGELLFTHFGISGPLVLSASAHMDNPDAFYTCVIDCKPALLEEQLDARLLRDFAEEPNRMFRNALHKLLPSAMIPTVVALSGIEPTLPVNQLSKQQRKALCALIKGLALHVTSPRPVEEAVITSGGVNVKEVNPATMESKLVKGLFFAGEILDVDAYTGGFNLQIAFSTGHLAGESAGGDFI